MSDEYRKQFMERELSEIMDAMEEVDSTDRVSVKALERQKRQLEERLEKLLSSKKDNSLCFEKLGFDYLVCDEAHNYKNCFVTTKMSNVAGVQTTAAQKSEDMLMKTQYLNDKYGCNNILFATGTPISTPYQRLLSYISPIEATIGYFSLNTESDVNSRIVGNIYNINDGYGDFVFFFNGKFVPATQRLN